MEGKERLPVLLHNALSVPQSLFSKSPSERLNALLERHDAPLLIRRARIEDLHYLIKYIGIEDAQELLLYAGPEQIRGIIEMEAFKGDEFVPERFIFYMDLVNDTSHDKALKVIKEMDPEAVALTILKYAFVKVVSEENDPSEEELPVMLTPDNAFYLVFRSEEAEGQAEVKRLLDLLYEADMGLARKVLFMCMQDTYSNLQEQLFVRRENMLEETGFPKYDERFDIYQHLPTGKIKELVDRAFEKREQLTFTKEPWADRHPFAIELYDVYTPGIFFDALTYLDRDALRKVMVDYRYLVDAVLRARFKDMSVEDAWQESSRMAAAFVSTALDFLADGDVGKAGFVLERFYLKEVFRVGFTLLDRIAKRTAKLVKEVGGEENLVLFGDLAYHTLKALLQFPPKVFKGVVSPGSLEEGEPWTYSEIRMVDRVVTQSEAVLWFMKRTFKVDIDEIASPHVDIEFSTLINTAASRAVLYGIPSTEPLNDRELKELIEKVLKDPEVVEGLKLVLAEEAQKTFKESKVHAEALAEFVKTSVERMVDELKGLDPSRPLDKRFIGNSVLVK